MPSAVALGLAGRSRRLFLWRLALVVVLTGLWCPEARGDRSLRQQDPAYMFEKKGEYARAALYWHRAWRGVREVWIPFMWGELSNAPPRFEKAYRKLVPEYEARLRHCLRLGRVGPAELSHIELINEIWMNELVEQEDGGFRASSGVRAVEAEKYGDFLLADVLRRGQARFFRTVAIPYHERAARTRDKQGHRSRALLHREAVRAYDTRAAVAAMVAKGDRALAKLPGLGGRSPRLGMGKLGHFTSTAIRDAFARRVLDYRGGRRARLTPEQATTILKDSGLHHADENVRLSVVTVLGNLGEREAVLSALKDSAPVVCLAAGKALAATRWADGWAACSGHRDASVRRLVEPLLAPAVKDALARSYVITELIRGLSSISRPTRSFCQGALERVTGRKLREGQWSAWWKKLGNARPGLVRTGPGVPPVVDERIDFGSWWDSGLASIRHRPNPLLTYRLPATIEWHGHLVVTQGAEYRFYVRNRGQSIRAGRKVRTPGRYAFPAYFPAQLVKLELDGRTLLPAPGAGVVEDPSAWVRLDFTRPIRLEPALHPIRLLFEIQSYDDAASAAQYGIWGGTPCVRLYWSSEHFLRELVPATCLVTIDTER